jgi:hypothetical protein
VPVLDLKYAVAKQVSKTDQQLPDPHRSPRLRLEPPYELTQRPVKRLRSRRVRPVGITRSRTSPAESATVAFEGDCVGAERLDAIRDAGQVRTTCQGDAPVRSELRHAVSKSAP